MEHTPPSPSALQHSAPELCLLALDFWWTPILRGPHPPKSIVQLAEATDGPKARFGQRAFCGVWPGPIDPDHPLGPPHMPAVASLWRDAALLSFELIAEETQPRHIRPLLRIATPYVAALPFSLPEPRIVRLARNVGPMSRFCVLAETSVFRFARNGGRNGRCAAHYIVAVSLPKQVS